MPYVNNVNAQHNEIAGTKCHKINDISKKIFFVFLMSDMWLSARVNYALSYNLWTTFQVFDGTSHPLLVRPTPVDPSVTARYVRINPVQWYKKQCLRMELYRCSLRNGKVLLHLF